jgi:hypothetical protein
MTVLSVTFRTWFIATYVFFLPSIQLVHVLSCNLTSKYDTVTMLVIADLNLKFANPCIIIRFK